MKSACLIAMSAVLLGATIGVSATLMAYNSKPSYAWPQPSVSRPRDDEPRTSSHPQIVVQGSAEYDFGVMSKGEERSHTFVILNAGDAPLTLQFADKSCQCTNVEMSRSIVPPGETTDITLSWRPNSYKLVYGQVARFETNDPARLELDLTIKGRVQQIFRAVPSSLSFDTLGTKEGREIEVVVYGYRDDDLAVERVEFLQESTAEFFEAEIAPLDETRIASEPGARSGSVIKLRLKPGMPIGLIQQRIRVQTNQPELTPLELPIHGAIEGNLQVIGGPRYDRNTRVLRLGALSGKDEYLHRLWILVKTDDSTASNLRIASTDPEGILEASLEEPTTYPSLKKYPLTIRIKPGGTLLNRLGNEQGSLAHIALELGEAESQQLTIYVSFLLEENPS